MERMPCHGTPASSLPDWLRLEASPTGLWADRQGLALGSRRKVPVVAAVLDNLSPSHVIASRHRGMPDRFQVSRGRNATFRLKISKQLLWVLLQLPPHCCASKVDGSTASRSCRPSTR